MGETGQNRLRLVEGGRVLGQVAKAPWNGVWRCWEATWRRWGIQAAKHTRAGRRGLFLPELAPPSARVRARLALHAPTPAVGHPSIATFDRSRPSAAPSSTVDRGLRPLPQIAGSRSMLQQQLNCRSIKARISEQLACVRTRQNWRVCARATCC